LCSRDAYFSFAFQMCLTDSCFVLVSGHCIYGRHYNYCQKFHDPFVKQLLQSRMQCNALNMFRNLKTNAKTAGTLSSRKRSPTPVPIFIGSTGSPASENLSFDHFAQLWQHIRPNGGPDLIIRVAGVWGRENRIKPFVTNWTYSMY